MTKSPAASMCGSIDIALGRYAAISYGKRYKGGEKLACKYIFSPAEITALNAEKVKYIQYRRHYNKK